MSKNVLILFSVMVVILLGIWGYYFYLTNDLGNDRQNRPLEAQDVISPSPTSIPTKLERTIKSIDNEFIVITAPEGDMTLPNDPNAIDVSRQSEGTLVPASISDLAVGMSVRVTVTKPGEKASIIIE